MFPRAQDRWRGFLVWLGSGVSGIHPLTLLHTLGPIAALLPGQQFRLSDNRGGEAFFGDGLRAGETKDLGDVRMQPLKQEE